MADLVLSLIGRDRPGLVEAVSAAVAGHGGNWLESRMAHLAGQFAGILRVQVAADQVAALARALHELERDGLRVLVETATGEPVIETPLLVLELLGQDRPGIVREIAHTLARGGVNVEELETTVESAPMSGERLFRARARLRLPAGLSPGELRRALDAVASDLMVDVTLVEAEPD